eukprot:4944309-Pleurochrysis_carterae.AAC.1
MDVWMTPHRFLVDIYDVPSFARMLVRTLEHGTCALSSITPPPLAFLIRYITRKISEKSRSPRVCRRKRSARAAGLRRFSGRCQSYATSRSRRARRILEGA